jgi:molybdate/tungstate transport system substrate-binding protein
MNNKTIAAIAIIIIVVAGVGIYGYTTYIATPSEKTPLVIFAAASLAHSMNATAAEFERQHPNVDVQLRFAGSGDLISQITQLNKSADIMASADYGLIDRDLMPNHTTWNLKYAKNELVIAYTDKSKNSTQINADNWYKILAQDDVKFGIADPNSAPAGYRAVMMMKLANNYYNNTEIFNLIANNTAITFQANGTGYIIKSPSNLNPTDKVLSRPNVRDTLTLIQTNAADYVFVYKSDAQQAGSGVKYLELPEELKISNTTFEPIYKNYKLIQFSDVSNKSKTVTLTPIVYGITILTNAPEKDLATQFMELLLSGPGTEISRENFIDPISPAIPTNGSTDIPNALRQYITATA